MQFDFISSVSRNWRHLYDDFAALAGNVLSIENEATLVMGMKLCADIGSDNGLIASFERVYKMNNTKRINFSFILDNQDVIVGTRKGLYDCINNSLK